MLATVFVAVLHSASAATMWEEKTPPLFGLPHLPPVGAVYERTLSLPVLGAQTVRIGILTPRQATLTLTGALMLDELLSYFPDEKTGRLAFELSERTIALLRRLGVGLRTAEYAKIVDAAFVTIQPPLWRPIVLRLDRNFSQ